MLLVAAVLKFSRMDLYCGICKKSGGDDDSERKLREAIKNWPHLEQRLMQDKSRPGSIRSIPPVSDRSLEREAFLRKHYEHDLMIKDGNTLKWVERPNVLHKGYAMPRIPGRPLPEQGID